MHCYLGVDTMLVSCGSHVSMSHESDVFYQGSANLGNNVYWKIILTRTIVCYRHLMSTLQYLKGKKVLIYS